MSKYVDWYFSHIKEILNKVQNTQMEKIDKAAELFAGAIEKGQNIFVFGASHAGIIAEELVYRTGGLALINPIFNSTLMLNTRPIRFTSQMERLEGFGTEIIKATPIKANDVLLIHSVSGRNSVAIDAAMAAQKLGAHVIVLTNMTYSKQVTSRHSSGKMLYELGDLVIDNCGDFEDSSTSINGLEQKVGPTSTAIGAVIVNSLVISTVEKLLEKKVIPPVFHSANMDGGDAFNQQIFAKYKDWIHYM